MMNFYEFVKASKKHDQRNIFRRTNHHDRIFIEKHVVDESLREFYWNMYPEDVELILKDDSIVMLFPLYQLLFLQQIYQCGDYFAFSLWDGDPICIKDERIYVAKKIGINKWYFHEIADNLQIFTAKLIGKLKYNNKIINFTSYKEGTGTSRY